LERHAGPADPVSIKCLSASPKPRRLSFVRSSSAASNCDAEVSSFKCPEVDAEINGLVSVTTEDSGLPFRRNASAPLVTKLENLLIDFPPSKLCRKLGNAGSHSPVFWGIITGSELCEIDDRGDPRGVIDELEASFFFVLVTSSWRLGEGVNSAVS